MAGAAAQSGHCPGSGVVARMGQRGTEPCLKGWRGGGGRVGGGQLPAAACTPKGGLGHQKQPVRGAGGGGSHAPSPCPDLCAGWRQIRTARNGAWGSLLPLGALCQLCCHSKVSLPTQQQWGAQPHSRGRGLVLLLPPLPGPPCESYHHGTLYLSSPLAMVT